MRRSPRSEEGSGTRIVRNSLLQGLGTFSAVGITLFLTPLLISELGVAGYGVWVLATSLTFALGYLSFAELGIESSTVRFIAEARSEGDVEEANRVISTSLALYVAIAAVLTPALMLAAAPIAGLFSVPEALQNEAALTFTIVAAQIAFDLPSRAFSGVIQGAQRYGVWQAVELTQVVTTAVVFAIVLLNGGGLVELAIASLIISVAVAVLNTVGALVVAPDTRVSRARVSRRMVRKVCNYGGQLVLFRAGALVYRQTGKTIIGVSLGAAFVTTYEIGFKLQAAAALVESMAASALIPAVAFNRMSPDRLRELFTRGTSYAMALALPIVVSGIVFADPVIRTWIGDGFDEAVGPARIFLGVLVISSMLSVGQAILTGLGRIKPMLVLAAIWIVTNLGLSILLVGPLGVEGVVLATLVSYALTAIPYMRLFLREVDVTPNALFRSILAPLGPAVAAQLVVSLLLLGFAERAGNLALVTVIAFPGVVAFVLVYLFVGLDRERRAQVVGIARSAVGFRTRPTVPVGLRDDVPVGDAPPSGQVP